MDMHTNSQINNQDFTSTDNNYTEITKDEFFNILFQKEDGTKITKALVNLFNTYKELNDKRYPVITTGKVESINEDGKISVKMITDDSETVETIGYINQTPFTINVNDYVKICKQTAGDKVNAWIIGVNNISNKEDAFIFVDHCLNYILRLQEEIQLLGESIKELSQAYEPIVETINVAISSDNIISINVPTIRINNTKMNSAISRINTLSSVNNDVNGQRKKLISINKGKKK